MEGYVNKEVCVNIELFLLVFVHEKSPRRAFASREWMSYGFLWIFAKYLTGVGCWRLASMIMSQVFLKQTWARGNIYDRSLAVYAVHAVNFFG